MAQPSSTYATGPKGWVSYRPELKVLDCTVRDGGLMNDHNFSLEFVKAIYEADVAAGVDYMEIGYKGAARMYDRKQYGTWKFCTETTSGAWSATRRVQQRSLSWPTPSAPDYHTDILPREKSAVDLYRVATYIHQIPAALDIVNDAAAKGYETTLNIMAVSTVPERELASALR